MTELDWERLRSEKDVHRGRLAARPFEQKLLVLERLRERTRAMRGSSRLITTMQLGSTSDVFVSLRSSEQWASGAIRLGVFGANSTLVGAAVSVQSSVSATTTGASTNDRIA